MTEWPGRDADSPYLDSRAPANPSDQRRHMFTLRVNPPDQANTGYQDSETSEHDHRNIRPRCLCAVFGRIGFHRFHPVLSPETIHLLLHEIANLLLGQSVGHRFLSALDGNLAGQCSKRILLGLTRPVRRHLLAFVYVDGDHVAVLVSVVGVTEALEI